MSDFFDSILHLKNLFPDIFKQCSIIRLTRHPLQYEAIPVALSRVGSSVEKAIQQQDMIYLKSHDSPILEKLLLSVALSLSQLLHIHRNH